MERERLRNIHEDAEVSTRAALKIGDQRRECSRERRGGRRGPPRVSSCYFRRQRVRACRDHEHVDSDAFAISGRWV